MPVIATIALEQLHSSLGEHRQVLANLELNNSCGYTSRCGSNCYLNVIAPPGKTTPLTPSQVLAAAREIIRNGWDVRHLGLPGKEIWETPNLVFEILEEFHSAQPHSRPGSVGIITAHAAALKRHARRLTDVPLGWTAISVDTPDSGLRLPQNNEPLLENALLLKESGGTELLGINTVITEGNVPEVLKIGRKLRNLGIDQWAVAPLLKPSKWGRMESVLSDARLGEIVDIIAGAFGGTDFKIVFDLDWPMLQALVGVPAVGAVGAKRWRAEYQLPTAPNILLVAGNPEPGHFFRLRFEDGQLMSKEDFRRVGLSEGNYGRYEEGGITVLLEELRSVRGISVTAA